MALTFRSATHADLDTIRRLWEEQTGWGPVTDSLWQRYVVAPPFGEMTVTVAENEDHEVVGSFVFVPQLAVVDGREVLACRPYAPIVSDRARGLSINPRKHPVIGMYLHTVDALRARGAALIYMVPDPRWVRVFRMFSFLRVGSFPLYRLPIDAASHAALPPGHAAVRLDLADPRIDALWADARRLHGCQVVRDRRVLPWKIGTGEYELVGVERDGRLVGLSASRAKGDQQWLICDVLAADMDVSLRAVLAATAHAGAAHAAQHPDASIGKVAVLSTDAMRPAIESLHFVRDDYDFPIVVHRLDETLSADAMAPERWYVSAND